MDHAESAAVEHEEGHRLGAFVFRCNARGEKLQQFLAGEGLQLMVAGLRRWSAQKMHTMRGRDITGWEQFEAVSDDGPLHVLMVDTETPVDAMRFSPVCRP